MPPEPRQPTSERDQCQSFRRRHSLQHAVAVDEVEPAAGVEYLARRREVDMRDTLPFGLSTRARQHRRRAIDGRHPAGAPGEGDREATDTAAKLERRDRRELRHQPLPDQPQQPVDVLFTAREELALAVRCEIGAEKLRRREHGEVRLARGERLPTQIRVVGGRAHSRRV